MPDRTCQQKAFQLAPSLSGDQSFTMFVIEFFGRDTREPARLFAETVLPKFRK